MKKQFEPIDISRYVYVNKAALELKDGHADWFYCREVAENFGAEYFQALRDFLKL